MSVKDRCTKDNLGDAINQEQMQFIIGQIQIDLAALNAAIVAMNAKLDAAGTLVTNLGTNYGATCNPVANQVQP